MAGRHVAITGGAGRLGCAVARRLREHGEPVRILDPDAHGPSLEGLDVERVAGSVLDPTALAALVDGARALIHCAAKVQLHADRDGSVYRVNVEGTRAVADACVAQGIRMVHTSSHAALDRRPLEAPLTEGNPLSLEDACDYHRSKAHAERVVLSRVHVRGLDAVIVSPGTLTGPWDYAPSILGGALIRLYRGELPVLLEAITDYTDVRDVADAVIAAIARGRAGERYLLTGDVLDIRAVTEAFRAVTGRPAPRRVLPLWVGWALVPVTGAIGRLTRTEPLFSPGMLRASRSNPVVSHEKAAAELGYAPRPLRDSLADAFAFYEARGALGD